MHTPSIARGGVVAALILTGAAHAAPVPDAPNSASGAFPYPLAETTLDNGLRVVTVKTSTPGFFALYGVVGTGSRDEVEAGHSGFAHFFEHMMFRGTKLHPSDDRVAYLASRGVDESGYTTDDYTCYSLTGPTAALPAIVELEADRYQNLVYSEDDFKTESRAVLGEYNKNFSEPDNKAYESLLDLAFDTHTYKHTTMGFLADIQKMPERYTYAQQFFAKFYRPDNVIFFVVGDVNPADVRALFGTHFAAWKGKRAQSPVTDEPALRTERRRAVAWASPTLPRLHVGWRVPSSVRDARAGAAALLLRGYLFSDSSSLTKRLVLDQQLAENVSSWFDLHRDASLFLVNARVKDEKAVDGVLSEIQAALNAIAAGDVDVARFAAVKSNLRYGALMDLTSPERIAGTLAAWSGPAMNPRQLDVILNALGPAEQNTPGAAAQGVSAAELSAFVRAWFAPTQRAVVVVAPGASSVPAGGGK